MYFQIATPAPVYVSFDFVEFLTKEIRYLCMHADVYLLKIE